MRRTVFLSIASVVFAGALSAQEVSRYSFNIGAGFVEPAYSTGSFTDVGWNVGGGAGVNFGPYVGALLDVNYNSLGINSATLAGLGTAGGNINIWSFTVDPIFHLTPKRRFDVYATGGGGLYRREDQLTVPSGGFGVGFFGQPFPFFYNQVVSDYTLVKPGWDAGLGIAFGTRWHGKFYAEARYNQMFTPGGNTDYIPVTFGFRW